MEDAPNLELANVFKRFGEVTAVNGLSLAVEQGEFVSLLGPSGCGKTTALRLIAGYDEVDDGDILIRGKSMRGVPPYRRNIGMVFQNYALFPHLTVAENVGFGLRERKVDRRQIDLNVGECLHLVQLDDLDNRYPSELSGGQQQRVALARALVIEPELLLLDEPLSNLDAQLREEMRIEIKELQAKLGVTTVFVTHDQVEALTLSTRVVIMRNGRAAQVGAPEEVYRRPRSRFAFEFLGGTNVFAGRLLDGAGADAVFETSSGLRIVARGPVASPATLHYLGLRPEEIAIRSADGLRGQNKFQGRIRSVLYRGWTREVVITLDHGETLKVIEVLPHAAHGSLPGDGEVSVSFAPEACHLLEED